MIGFYVVSCTIIYVGRLEAKERLVVHHHQVNLVAGAHSLMVNALPYENSTCIKGEN